MKQVIFEFGYEGGYDIVEFRERKVHFHSSKESEYIKNFDSLEKWWEYYTSINKYWKHYIHRYEISEQLKPVIRNSLIKDDIIKFYKRGIERCEEAIVEYQDKIVMMKDKFDLTK